ncbi:MAG: extracellular solute-binding protein [Roseburia sp.]|nr:extracellular solute-binding protein [Roseburia sp.]
MKIKKLVALGLSIAMVLTTIGCGNNGEPADSKNEDTTNEDVSSGVEEKDLSWLNSDGTLPIVKEGTEKTLRLLVQRTSGVSTDIEDVWMYKFIEEFMNINLEVETFNADNRNEMLTLAFAADELPDVIIGGGFDHSELMKYGSSEGQIIDLSPYINETYMPNLSWLISQYPSIPNVWTDGDGHIWSTGYISDMGDSSQGIQFMMANYDCLKDIGREYPETLDELYDCMLEMKALYGDDFYPLGGCYALYDPSVYILNALGYVCEGAGIYVSKRNGEVVFPIADREVFGEYIKFMHNCYKEGLIHPDFFTMSGATAEAIKAEGKNFLWAGTVSELNEEAAKNSGWWGARPLTSDYSDTKQWPQSNMVTTGGFVITRECEDPELACALVDFFYNGTGYALLHSGPQKDVSPEEWYMGMTEGANVYEIHGESGYAAEAEEKGMDEADYVDNYFKMFMNASIGTVMSTPYMFLNARMEYEPIHSRPYVFEYETEEEARADESGWVTGGWALSCLAVSKTLGPYITTDVVGQCYLESDIAEMVSDIEVPLRGLAKQEIAKFVVGKRSLDTLDAYFDELDSIGAQTVVDAYAAAIANRDK